MSKKKEVWRLPRVLKRPRNVLQRGARPFLAGARDSCLRRNDGDWERVIELWILRAEGVAISQLNVLRQSADYWVAFGSSRCSSV